MEKFDINKYTLKGGYEAAARKDPTREYQDIFRKHNIVIHDNSIGNILDLMALGREYDEDDFIIPDYQRGLVWSPEQKENLIKSILWGVPMGTFVFTRRYERGENGRIKTNVYGIVDGQQRYNAIKDFLDNKFQVDGKFYKDLKPLDAYAFTRFTNFGSMIINNPSREVELDFYFTLNFGGTAHSKKDLEIFLKAKDNAKNNHSKIENHITL